MNIWQDRIQGAIVLDLFAGSGVVGIEALSRGATECVFVDHDSATIASLRSTLATVGVDSFEIYSIELPATDFPSRLRQGFQASLVFADPPYAFTRFPDLLASLESVVSAGGRLAVEHASKIDLPEAAGRLEPSDRRSYGDSTLSFYRSRSE